MRTAREPGRRSPHWVREALPGLVAAAIIGAGGALARRRLGAELALDLQSRRADLAPIVDVVVTPRGHPDDISGCVLSLWAAGANRVIVVDDAIADSTGRLAAAVGAEAITVTGTPAGWLGRPHTRWLAAEKTTAPWIAFVDADVRLGPGSLDALVDLCDREGLAAVSPALIEPMGDVLDRLCRPVAHWLEGLANADGASSKLDGRCMLIRGWAYRLAGGHAHPAVRQSRSEEADLGRLLSATGRVSHAAGEAGGAMRPTPERPKARAWLGRGIDSLAAAVHADRARAVAAAVALTSVPLLLVQTAWRATPGRLLGAVAAYGAGTLILAPVYGRAQDSRLALLHPAASLLLPGLLVSELRGRRRRDAMPATGGETAESRPSGAVAPPRQAEPGRTLEPRPADGGGISA